MTVIATLLKKELLLTKRSLSRLIFSIGMPVAFFLLFSGLWVSDKTMNHEMVISYTRRYLFSMSAFSSLSFALFSLPFTIFEDRTEGRMRLLRYSPISFGQYYVVKVIRTTVYFLMAIITVCLVGHFARGINLDAKDWVVEGVILVLGASSFMPLGVLLSYLKSSELLSIIGNILYMGLAILGGLWMPVSMFPEWIQNLSKLTPTYHFNQILIGYFDGKFPTDSILILCLYTVIILAIVILINKKMQYQIR